MERLEPQLRNYAWGSHEAIARLTGRAWPTPEPEAELWMGAHEAAPSRLLDSDRSLLDAVAAAPQELLGTQVSARFGGRLPFLLKVLAPVQALSIQAHPSAQQALAAPAGTYADGLPKPEAFCALTPFHVFAGSRSFAETRSLAGDLGVPELGAHLAEASARPDPSYALLARLLHLAPGAQAELADAVTEACAEHGDQPALAAVASVAQHHPRDIGLVVLLTMQHRVFEPGDYAFVPAGVLHAYVHGVAVEIMANSDNVVRAGLTQKKLDREELLRIVDLDGPPRTHPGELIAGWRVFPADTDYFRLRTARPAGGALAVPDAGRPRILLAVGGAVELSAGARTLRLEPGSSCFLTPHDTDVTVRGEGTVFLAAPGC